MSEKLYTTLAENVSKRDCSEEVWNQLKELPPLTWVELYGEYSFRLADDEPSYYITQIKIWKP